MVHFLIHETGFADRRKRLGVRQLDTSAKKSKGKRGRLEMRKKEEAVARQNGRLKCETVSEWSVQSGSNHHTQQPPTLILTSPHHHSKEMLKRAVGWLKDKTGGGGSAKGKRNRDAYEDQEKDIDVWADDHLMYTCPFAPLEQPRPQQSPSSLLPCAAYEDVDLSSDAGNNDDDGESSPPPPSYHSLAASAGMKLDVPPSLLVRGPSERVLPLLKRARHTQTPSEGAGGMLYLGAAPIINQAQRTNSTSTSNSRGNPAGLPDVYLDFFDVFDLPASREATAPPQQDGQEGEDGDNGTVVDDGEEGDEEESKTELADDKAALEDDDDDHSSCSSPLFPPVAAKSKERHHVQSNSNAVGFFLGSPAPAYGVASISRPFTYGSFSPATIIYTFTSEIALRALVAPEALGLGGSGQWKEQSKAANVKNDKDEDEDEDALFGRRPARSEQVGTLLSATPTVIWERVEVLVDCKVELSEEGSALNAGPDLQSGVPLLFGIDSETFWSMEDVVCVNLYRSVEQLGNKSLLLLAKQASDRPPWAPERLEVVVVPLDTKATELNAAAMLSLLAPAHARGPAKGGDLELKLHVFEGRGELGRRSELADLVALLDGHDGAWTKVGCYRHGGQSKRKQE